MAKKPAIELQPQGIDDIGRGIVRGAKAIGRAFNKPKSVTVNRVSPRTTVKSKGTVVPNEYGLPKYRQRLIINSKPANYSETYMKGTKEYKEAIRAEKIKGKSLKDVNKYDAARKKRATEYNSAMEAQKVVKAQEKKYGFAVGPEEDFVKKFTGMSPRRVRSGRR